MQDAGMPRRTRALPLLLAAVLATGGCALDRAEMHETGGVIRSEIDDLSVLTYRDDPDADDWVDVVSPDAAVLEEGDAFREEDSRTAEPDEPADVRRLFTRIGEGRTVLVQLDRRSGELQLWDFVDGTDGPVSATGIASGDRPTEVDDGGYVTVVRAAGAGEATVVVEGDDDVTVERVATHGPSDGVDLHVDVYVVDGTGRSTIIYRDERGATDYVVVAV